MGRSTSKRAGVAKSDGIDLRSEAHAADTARDALLKAHTFSVRETSGGAPPPDEAEKTWQGVGAIIPPYEPYVLLTLLEHSNSLRQCVDAYVTNIDAFGHRFEPIIDLTAVDANDRLKAYLTERGQEKDPAIVADPSRQVAEPTPDQIDAAKRELIEKMRSELTTLQNFFEYACLDQSFTSLRRQTRQDIETLGNAYWECIKDEGGCLAGFEYMPGFTVRHMSQDAVPTPISVRAKKNEFQYHEIQTHKRFRRFVQVFESRVIWFKEFGDPRVVSRRDGTHFENEAALKQRDAEDEPATELLHFRVHTSKSSYGIPRWVGVLLSVLGSRQAEEVNLTYFENKSVPPLAVLVSGGRISNSTVERISNFIENDIKGKKNFHKILVLEAESPGTSGFDNGRMKIELKPLTAAQHNDALFQNYDERNMDKVGQAFRLPRMLRGDIRDFNRSTADAAIEFAEQQVFKPERDEFDFIVNRKILPALNIKFWRFKSNAAAGHNATELATILTQLGQVGFITPAEGRDLMEPIFNRPFQKITAPWVLQPLQLTTSGIVPPDQLMAPGMTTPQAAATGATPPGGDGLQGPQAPAAAAPPVEGAKVTLTGTDAASVVTVNEARKDMGLGALKRADGSDDPDGFLTVAEFKAKRSAAGQALGQAQGTGEAQAQGFPPSSANSTPEKNDLGTADLASGGALVPAPPARRRREEDKRDSMLSFVKDLLMLRKALEVADQDLAQARFDDLAMVEQPKIAFEVGGQWVALTDLEKAKGKEYALITEHPTTGARSVSFHPSRAAAQRAGAEHLKANGGSGKLAFAPKGKEHMVQPLPAQLHTSGGSDHWANQYGSG